MIETVFSVQNIPFIAAKRLIYSMKVFKQVRSVSGIMAIFGFLLIACEPKKAETVSAVKPRDFDPVAEETTSTPVTVQEEKILENNQPEPAPVAVPERKPMPTVAELQKITPEQEATRALNNDAMKAATMSFEKFGKYMQSRIPYYKNKGNLKAKNDFTFIQISSTEMQIETAKGRLVYPMK